MQRREFLVAFVVAGSAAVARGAYAADASAAVATSAQATTPGAGAAAAPSAADWRSVYETLFPHTSIDRALYDVPAGALIAAAAKDAGTAALLGATWQSLGAAAGGSWANASAAERTRAVATLAGLPAFGVLRQTFVFTFYVNPAVWSAFGYEGDAWSHGGWAGRTEPLDWLPVPPVAAPGRG